MTETAFIVGNGPSINCTNLDLLEGKPLTFGMNRIHLHYGKPGCEVWRPTHYVFVDYQTTLEFGLCMQELASHIRAGEETYVGTELYGRTFKKLKCVTDDDMPANVHFLEMCSRHFGGDYLSPSAPKRWHLDEEPKWCKFASGWFVAAQVAASLGCNPLVVLGCDLGYKPIDDVKGDPNHFDPSYVQLYPHKGVTGHTVVPPGYDEYTNRKLRYGHRVAKRSCDELGISIYNATTPPANSALDGIYEYRPLEDFL